MYGLKRTFQVIFIILGIYAVIFFSIGSKADQIPNEGVDFSKAIEVYKDNCASCHGKKGNARTLMAKMMKPPKPKDFRVVLNDPAMNEDKLFQIITEGKPGTKMRGFPELSDDERRALVHYVQSFKTNQS